MIYAVWQHFIILGLSLLCGMVICLLYIIAKPMFQSGKGGFIGETGFWCLMAAGYFMLWQCLYNGAIRPLYMLLTAMGFITAYALFGRKVYIIGNNNFKKMHRTLSMGDRVVLQSIRKHYRSLSGIYCKIKMAFKAFMFRFDKNKE